MIFNPEIGACYVLEFTAEYGLAAQMIFLCSSNNVVCNTVLKERILLCFHVLLYAMSRKQTPSDFLKQIIGRPVVVKLNSGADYRGVLACLDSYMNIALEQTEEYVNGQLKNKYGDAFIRGNNVLYISTQKSRR